MFGPAAWNTVGATNAVPVPCCADTVPSLPSPHPIKVNPIPNTKTNWTVVLSTVASFPNGASLHDRRGDSSPTIVASGSMLRLLHGNCHAARTTFRTSTHSCLLSWNEELGERSGIQWRNLHQSQNDRMKSGDLSKVKMEGENR